MKKITFLLLLLTLSFHVFAAKRAITEKDLFRFQWVADPQVAPDGSEVAYVRVEVNQKKDRYETSLWSVATTPGAAPRRITNGPRDTTPRWSPDGKTLAFLRSGEKDGKPAPPQIQLLSLAGGEPRALTSMPQPVASIAWSPDGRTIAFTAGTKPDDFKDEKKKDDDGERESDVRIINQAVYRQNGQGYLDPSRPSHIWTIEVPKSLESAPKPKQLTSGELDDDEAVWSPDGSRLYFTSDRRREAYYDTDDQDLFVIPAAGGEATKVADIDGPIDHAVPSPNGEWIAFRGTITKPVRSYNQSDLWVIAADGATPARNLTTAYDSDVLSGLSGDQRAPRGNGPTLPVWSADSTSIVLSSIAEGKQNLIRIRINAADGSVQPVTKGAQDVMTYSIRGGKTVALVSSPTRIGDLFLVRDDGSMARLTDVNGPLFDELTITEPEEAWVTSFDGKKIETWIQKPPNFDPAKKYPLILNIHGGPHAAYGYTFDHEFQWMAAKGYVVVYPNPRGSTSYGQDFGNIIQYKYPGDDYKDLMACVDTVIARGYIDPKKLAVTGGSGGGLLTNWTITQTDRFAAAASQRSIADWANLWYVSDFSQFQPFWFRKAPWEDPQDFIARSPITYIDKVHTPLMLIEGEADWRTPPMAGGEIMFRALKYLHRPTVMVRFPDESHELSRSGKPWHRVERLQHIVGWFDQWINGAKDARYAEGLR